MRFRYKNILRETVSARIRPRRRGERSRVMAEKSRSDSALSGLQKDRIRRRMIGKRWIAVRSISLHQNSAISMSQGGRARHSENSFIKAERSSVGRTVAAPTWCTRVMVYCRCAMTPARCSAFSFGFDAAMPAPVSSVPVSGQRPASRSAAIASSPRRDHQRVRASRRARPISDTSFSRSLSINSTSPLSLSASMLSRRRCSPKTVEHAAW